LSDQTEQNTHKEPSLGPACLVISILMLATVCAVCGIGGWFMFSDQFPLAQRGIQEQLIPWIEQSELSSGDKQSIVRQLNGLLPSLRERSLTPQQLSRLRNCLQDNPVFLWGVVQSIQAQAAEMAKDTSTQDGLTDVELNALGRISGRLLRCAAERKLSRTDLEFAVQSSTLVRKDGSGIESKSNLDAENVRQFMTRAEGFLKSQKIPDEPYEKSPGEALEILLQAALTVE
jgi:hypothetical protein